MSNEVITSSVNQKESGIYYGYVLVGTAFIAMTIFWGSFYSFGIFFKPLSQTFGWSRAVTSGAFSASSLISGLLGLIAGRMADKINPRQIITVAGILFGLGYILMSRINGEIWQFYLIYFGLIGVGISTSVTTLTTMVARWFVKKRGLMVGLVVSGIGAGTLIMNPLANYLLKTYDWQMAYVIMGIIAFIFIIIPAQFLKKDPGQIGQLAYGEDTSAKQSNVQIIGLSLGEAMKTWQFWILTAIELCFGFWLMVIVVHMVPYATGVGISATNAALVLAFMGGISVAGRILMGMFADKTSVKAAFIISFAFMAVSLIGLPWARDLWMLVLFSAVFGFGYGGESPLRPMMVAQLFGLKAMGFIHSAVFMGFSTGSFLGPLVAGRVFDESRSYHWAFVTCIMLGILGLALLFTLKPIARK